MSVVEESPCPITVLGAGGWIGGALVAYLRRQGLSVRAVDRSGLQAWLEPSSFQAHESTLVVYAIGLTADFRTYPHATTDAHVSLLNRVLQRPGLNNLLYLSSTRVYARSLDTYETSPLPCLSSDPSDLYNLTKLLGESLVLQDSRPGFKVVRLSNVVGTENQPGSTFLGALLGEARANGMALIRQPENTVKNYVALADVVRLMPLIAKFGQKRLYNLGSHYNLNHGEVAAWLRRQGYDIRFASATDSCNALSFPPLAIDRLSQEFQPPGHPFCQTIL